MRNLWRRGAVLACSIGMLTMVSCKAEDAGGVIKICMPGAALACGCPSNPALTTTCNADGSAYQPCACGGSGGAGSSVGGGAAGMGSGGKSASLGSGGMTVPAGTPQAGRSAGASGTGSGGVSTASAGKPGSGGAIGGGSGGSGSGGAAGGTSSDETSMLRDACVAEINMYRATRPDAPPLKRASAAQETCSDKGAQSDGDSMMAHGFFQMPGSCIQTVGLSAQDTCPGYPVGGGFGGAATVLDALKGCLQQMWAEGEPSQGRAACMSDISGCFQMHGHYLNMSNPKATAASCAFYKMKDGKSWWMNQDFVVTWP